MTQHCRFIFKNSFTYPSSNCIHPRCIRIKIQTQLFICFKKTKKMDRQEVNYTTNKVKKNSFCDFFWFFVSFMWYFSIFLWFFLIFLKSTWYVRLYDWIILLWMFYIFITWNFNVQQWWCVYTTNCIVLTLSIALW